MPNVVHKATTGPHIETPGMLVPQMQTYADLNGTEGEIVLPHSARGVWGLGHVGDGNSECVGAVRTSPRRCPQINHKQSQCRGPGPSSDAAGHSFCDGASTVPCAVSQWLLMPPAPPLPLPEAHVAAAGDVILRLAALLRPSTEIARQKRQFWEHLRHSLRLGLGNAVAEVYVFGSIAQVRPIPKAMPWPWPWPHGAPAAPLPHVPSPPAGHFMALCPGGTTSTVHVLIVRSLSLTPRPVGGRGGASVVCLVLFSGGGSSSPHATCLGALRRPPPL